MCFKGCSQYFPVGEEETEFGTLHELYKVSELETVLSTDDYIEKEFLLEKFSKVDTPRGETSKM